MKALILTLLVSLTAACFYSPSTTKHYDVTYEVQGWSEARITYSNATGGTEFRDGPLPWQLKLRAKQGDFLYVAAHNVGEGGGLEVHILVNGQIRKSASVQGSGIATADYLCCDF